MSVTQINRLWFEAHPDREYRLRRQTPGELARWPVHPGPEFEAWCIIRRRDAGMEVFAIKIGAEATDDHDFELGVFFDHLREAA